MDGNATHLSYTNGTTVSKSNNLLGIELGRSKYKYSGESSMVQAMSRSSSTETSVSMMRASR